MQRRSPSVVQGVAEPERQPESTGVKQRIGSDLPSQREPRPQFARVHRRRESVASLPKRPNFTLHPEGFTSP